MRYLTLLLAAVMSASLVPSSASASDWMFRPSYYSHAPAFDVRAEAGHADAPPPPLLYPQPVPRSAYRPAHAQLGPGFAVRSTYRYNVYRLWSGRSFDTTIYRNFSLEATAAQ